MKDRNVLFILAATAFILASYFTLGRVFVLSEGKSLLAYEFIAAILGSVITVSAMIVMIKIQSQQEKEKEFSSRLFEQKLSIYQKLVDTLFKTDDDNLLTKSEIQEIENQIGAACLLSSIETVSIFSQFLFQLKVYGVLYWRNMETKWEIVKDFRAWIEYEKKMPEEKSNLAGCKYLLEEDIEGNERAYFVSLDELIQAMRKDLDVVQGDISNEIEHFILLPYDAKKLISDPNKID